VRLVPRTGATPDGNPLSLNRAPTPDLAPWISRVFVLHAEAPAEYRMHCTLFNDTPYIRLLTAGDWIGSTGSGSKPVGHDVYIFGPQTVRMPVSVRGTIFAAGLGICPAAWATIAGDASARLVDDIEPLSTLAINTDRFKAAITGSEDRSTWLDMLEDAFRDLLVQRGMPSPDPLCEAFDRAALIDPNFVVADFADAHGVSQNRLTRSVRRGFGLTPKAVLRRSRVLDLAAQLLGVGDPDEAEDLMMRYFDQSHIIREFRSFFGLTPRQFRLVDRPILRLSLESRQARRREAIERAEQEAG
jgi:AraC-like DNA-binding protein